jgi:hypothetical protein
MLNRIAQNAAVASVVYIDRLTRGVF